MRSAHFERAQFFLDVAVCSDSPCNVKNISHQKTFIVARVPTFAGEAELLFARLMSINAPPCAARGYTTRKIVHTCLAERGVNLHVNFWVAFQHVCCRREKNQRKSSTIDRHNCFQTRVGQCRCPDQAACARETGTRHHRVRAGHHSLWRPVERFASCVDGDVVGRESAFRNGRRRRLVPLLSDLDRPIKNRRKDDTSGSQDKPTATWTGTERSKAGRWTWTADYEFWRAIFTRHSRGTRRNHWQR